MLNLKTRLWTFRVRAKVQNEDEILCVSGSDPNLGQWKTSSVIPMECIQREESNDSLWQCRVELPSDQKIHFRYCVCQFVKSLLTLGKDITTVVKRWETDLKTRTIGPSELPDEDSVHEFGFISDFGRPMVQSGWLCSETLIELKLHDSPLHLWKKKHKDKDLFIKITPVDVNAAAQSKQQQANSLDLDESVSVDVADAREKKTSWPIVSVATFDDESCKYHPQSQFGVKYNENGFISFQVQVLNLQTVAFLVDIFGQIPGNSDIAPEPIGSCYLLPSYFRSTEGRVEVTILSKRFIPVGQFLPFYIIAYPNNKHHECDLSISYAKHWKSNWSGMDVGHRGLGDSFTTSQYCSHVRENTIASLKHAVSHGADMVEFDVQLSKDLVPIIYHDFDIVTNIVKKKGEKESMMHKMPLKNLTLEQLHSLKINHIEELSAGEEKVFVKNEHPDHDDYEPFPTLERAFNELDPHCGFNIEIKWDMEFMDGTRESHNAFEINLFIDSILDTVMLKSNNRKIFFSSFNPDVCTILRCKQNKYPILLLTQGVNDKWDNYRDPRTWNILNASKFAESSEILGINALGADLIRDPEQVQFVRSRNQVLFSWTDDRSDKATVSLLKGMGVDGLVYDRMDVNNSKEVKESIFLKETRMEQNEKESQDKKLTTSEDKNDNTIVSIESNIFHVAVV